jgi:hypothetical protein
LNSRLVGLTTLTLYFNSCSPGDKGFRSRKYPLTIGYISPSSDIVVGESLVKIITNFPSLSNRFEFQKIGAYELDEKGPYSIYILC